MDMCEIDVCYKIIFEAMLEKPFLECLADRIRKYTKSDIIFLSGAGKLLAYSCLAKEELPSFIEKKHLTLHDYERYFQNEQTGDRFICITPVYVQKRIGGYILSIYDKQERRDFFRELGNILVQTVSRRFEELQKKQIYNQSLREHILAWTMMEAGIEEINKQKDIPSGKYMTALFSKKENQEKQLERFLRGIYSYTYVYEEEDDIAVLFYELTEEDENRLYEKIEEKQIECCISEGFNELRLCKAKKELLKRMSSVDDGFRERPVKREKDWSIQGLYTYASPLIEEAGLSDYSVLRLIREDEEKNTELYYTLKMYLLCESNVTVAAKRMHLHRNTLVYRLKQIKECIGIDFNDNEKSRELLAFMMMYDSSRQM